MGRSYHQYCPVAHSLDLVGERWSLLVVRELLRGPQRYSDLHERLPGCGTNVLAARLRRLEEGGVVHRHRLPPPAASTVYELTAYGQELRRVVHELARWGVRSIGPPAADEYLHPGWLPEALGTITELQTDPPEVCVEFRVGDEVCSFASGVVTPGAADDPDAVVSTDPPGLYHLFVDGGLDHVEIAGDRDAVARVVGAAALGPPLALQV
jgi:DNA-binding HxlR family transcriptional regulator